MAAPSIDRIALGRGRAAVPERGSASHHQRELVLNHLWETANAAAKILCFALATPLMLVKWGAAQFGLFAVANSCVALMAIVDLGLRMLTRRRLTNLSVPEQQRSRLHATHLVTFAAASGATLLVVGVLAATGFWHQWLQLPTAADAVILTTCGLTLGTMFLQLLFEPIAAACRLSHIKALLFAGNVLALVVVVALLSLNVGVALTCAAYFAALALPLLLFVPSAPICWRELTPALRTVRARDVARAVSAGRWLNLITASWLFQSYGLVLLISWLLGPAAAGTFFLYLKLAELIGVLGASASEPTIAAIGRETRFVDRYRQFAISYRSAVTLCLAGAVGCAFFAGNLFRHWLGQQMLYPYTGLLIGLFGVATGFTRIVAGLSIALDCARTAALGLLSGAIGLIITTEILGQSGLQFILLAGCGILLFLAPAAKTIARELGHEVCAIWFKPIIDFVPALLAITAICAVAANVGSLLAIASAIVLSSAIALLCLFQPTMSDARGSDAARVGYDTRSWRSALVMQAVDLLNPFRRAEAFAWRDPCVVSSTAGLGDLFIHLPLIAGVVNEAAHRGIDVRVALRPAHAALGRCCGWNVLTFDNALENFFKNAQPLQPFTLMRQWNQTRRQRAQLWIDLTGSAVSACALKWAGAHKIAARVTRGGRSLVNHRLPHSVGENEYANAERVAEHIGCELDQTVLEHLRGEPLPGCADAIVLCLTTACSWKNWPLANYLALIARFPEERFVVTGLTREIGPADRPTFAQILEQPNVHSHMDETSVLRLVRLIAHACAVVTNDTSVAHIANAFGKEGAVLFGPTSPARWAPRQGLKAFVDAGCPYYPCVQWKCANQEDWCMPKISVDAVATHLGAALSRKETYAAIASGF